MRVLRQTTEVYLPLLVRLVITVASLVLEITELAVVAVPLDTQVMEALEERAQTPMLPQIPAQLAVMVLLAAAVVVAVVVVGFTLTKLILLLP